MPRLRCYATDYMAIIGSCVQVFAKPVSTSQISCQVPLGTCAIVLDKARVQHIIHSITLDPMLSLASEPIRHNVEMTFNYDAF
jgi:hypothetical protein